MVPTQIVPHTGYPLLDVVLNVVFVVAILVGGFAPLKLLISKP